MALLPLQKRNQGNRCLFASRRTKRELKSDVVNFLKVETFFQRITVKQLVRAMTAATASSTPAIDREKVCPLLLRVFCSATRHNNLVEYNKGELLKLVEL